MTSVANATSAAAATASSSSSSSTQLSATEQSDRFLKLLVTQMKNQDPLNPMDNAQITSQMAQISTVSGIDKMASAVSGLNSLMLQTQSLEGAMLVGKDVLVPGKKIMLDADGATTAGFELDSAATSVVVSIKDSTGKVVDTVDMGAASAGKHVFEWTSANKAAAGLTFEVNASKGGTAIAATRLVADRVESVYSDQGQLGITLKNNGNVKYADVRAVS
jgi:flagellar basal-body rod modification protein FlgD